MFRRWRHGREAAPEEEQETRRSEVGGGSNWEVPVHFALLTPRAGAHAELLALLQAKIVAPLIHRRILSEFRVLTVTPPSFLVEAATLVVFELTVPCPWPITDWDVRQWQRRLGSGVHLVVAPSTVPRRAGSWDAERARSALARAMVLPPTRKGPPPRKQAGGWMSSCVARSSANGPPEVIAADIETQPTLAVVEESSGQRVRLTPGATLMSAAVAADLCQHLPVSLRWRTSWRLVYSPRLHGVSLKTFYRRMESEGPSLLLVQDHCGCVFGGFATAAWHAADRYFGSGECFVFRFRRRLPKPVIPLLQHTQLLAAAQSGEAKRRGSAEEAQEQAAMETIKLAVKVLSDWHPKVRAEAERAERAAAAAGCVTSPTEALDEVLGRAAKEAAASDQALVEPEAPAPGPPAKPEAAAAPDTVLAQAEGEAQSRRSSSSRGETTAGGLGLEEDEPGAEPTPGASEDAPEEDEEGDDGDLGLEAYHWALKDPFFLFSDMECLAMGGGSSFALYLEKDLLHGMSEPCSTFGSETLASADNFIISNLECWVFDDPTEVEKSS